MVKKIAVISAGVIALATFIFSAVKINGILSEYRQGAEIYEKMAEYAEHTEDATVHTDGAADGAEEPKQPVIAFDAIKQVNPDCVAWIRIEDTEINYPVLQGNDNSYYLRRLIDGTWNICGSIFLDYRVNADMTDRHTVIYGHNMRNSGMFTDLMKYKKQDFYDSHSVGYLFTPLGNFRAEFFAGYVAAADSNAWQTEFESDAEFEAWVQNAVEKSTFKSGITPSANDRILTLSTCSYEFSNARYVLLGILREYD